MVFLLIGIWDVMSSQQVVDYVSQSISKGLEISDICESLTTMCLAPGGLSAVGCDNMTVVICCILNGKTKEEWMAMVKSRYDANPTEEVSTANKFE